MDHLKIKFLNLGTSDFSGLYFKLRVFTYFSPALIVLLVSGLLQISLLKQDTFAGHPFDSQGKRTWKGFFQNRGKTEGQDSKRIGQHQTAKAAHENWVRDHVGEFGVPPIDPPTHPASPIDSKQAALLKRFEDQRHATEAARIESLRQDGQHTDAHLNTLHLQNDAKKAELHATLEVSAAHSPNINPLVQARQAELLEGARAAQTHRLDTEYHVSMQDAAAARGKASAQERQITETMRGQMKRHEQINRAVAAPLRLRGEPTDDELEQALREL